MRNAAVILLVVVAVCMSVSSHAATFQLNPIVSWIYDRSYTPLPQAPGVPGNFIGGAWDGDWYLWRADNGLAWNERIVLQVDFLVSVSNLAAGEDGFGRAEFDVVFSSGFSEVGVGWQANNPPVDTNGALPGGTAPLFAQNGDYGASIYDAKGIVISMASGPFTNVADPRRNFGESTPGLIGTLFVEWDSRTASHLLLDNVQFSVKLEDGSFVGGQPGTTGVVSTVWEYEPPIDPEVPEPATLSLVGLGLIGLSLRRYKR